MNHRRAGYSLFEVLIAFAILTTVLATLIPGQAKLLSRVNQQDERFLAQDYAYSRMAKIGVTSPLTEGSQTDTYRNWHIVEGITKTTLDGTDIEQLKIVIEVQSSGGKQLARVETLRGVE